MKKYIEPSIMLVSILNSESVLNTLSGGDEEGYGDPMANINGYNDEADDRDGGRGRGGAVWDDFDEEEDY